MKIRTKLILALLLVSLPSLITVAVFTSRSAYNMLEEQLGDNSLQYSRLVISRVNENIHYLLEKSIAWTIDKELSIEVQGRSSTDLSNYLNTIYRDYQEQYSYLAYVNTEGTITAASGEHLDKLDYENDIGFKEALLGNQMLQEVSYDENAQGYTLKIWLPLKDKINPSGITGVLLCAVNWNYINQNIIAMKIRGKPQTISNHVMLIDRNGLAIAGYDDSDRFVQNLVDVGMESAREVIAGRSGYKLEESEHGVFTLATYTPWDRYMGLPDFGWSIILLQDADDIFYELSAVNRTNTLIVIFTILCVMIGSGFIAYRISKPILQVAKAADSIRKGDWDQRVKVASKDEIGILAKSFNEMIDALQSVSKQLADKSMHLDNILRSATEYAIITTDLNYCITYYNPMAENIYGHTFDEVIGKTVQEIHFRNNIDPQLLEIAVANVNKYGEHKFTSEHICDHNETRIIESRISGIKNPANEIVGYAVFSQDVTRRIATEQSLLDSEDKFRTITTSANDAIVIVNSNNIVTYWNESAQQIFEFSKEEAIGNNIHNMIIPPGTRDIFSEAFIQFSAATEHENTFNDISEFTAIRKNNDEFPVEMSLSIVKIGGEWHAIAMLREITLRKKAENELRKSNSKILELNQKLDIAARKIKNIMTDVVENNSFSQRYENPSLLKCWEIRQCNKTLCPAYENQDNLRCWEIAGTFCREGVEGELANNLHDCQKCAVYAAARKDSVNDLGETFNNMIMVLEDRQIALENALHITEAANKAKSEFLANMSHEIRTPMTAILGFADILQDPTLSPEDRSENIQTIIRNGEHLLQIINDILDLSKFEAGKVSVEILECCPRQILDDVVALMQVKASVKGLRLSAICEDTVPDVIMTDPTRLQQVLLNLVGNAIKFTDTGEVKIRADITKTSLEVNYLLRIRVIDTGIGISQDQIDSLFEPFQQADTSVTRKYGGSGLGLAISKRIVNKLGGKIHVYSETGKGTTFKFTIGMGDYRSPEQVNKKQQKIPSRKYVETIDPEQWDEIQKNILDNTKCLLAEDGIDNLRLITFYLNKSGATVDVAENGQIAMDMALNALKNGTPYDVILMDMQMPVMDGYTATHKLRKNGYTLPIIALTAHAMSGNREECIDAGCDDYATKPITKNELIALIYKHLIKSEKCA